MALAIKPKILKMTFTGSMPALVLPNALKQGRTAADDKGLGQGEFQDAKQDEKKMHGHGAIHARQFHLHCRGQDGDDEIASELEKVVGMPVKECRPHRQKSE